MNSLDIYEFFFYTLGTGLCSDLTGLCFLYIDGNNRSAACEEHISSLGCSALSNETAWPFSITSQPYNATDRRGFSSGYEIFECGERN